mgnify:CR=1 FL=1
MTDSKSTSSIPWGGNSRMHECLQREATQSDMDKPESGGLASPPEGAGGHQRGDPPPWLTGKILKEIGEEVRILRMIEEARYTTHTIVRQQPSYLTDSRAIVKLHTVSRRRKMAYAERS